MASDINRTKLSSRLLIILSPEVDVWASLQGSRTGKKTAAAPWLFFRAARDVSRKRLQWAAPPNPGRARESPTLAHSPTPGGSAAAACVPDPELSPGTCWGDRKRARICPPPARTASRARRLSAPVTGLASRPADPTVWAGWHWEIISFEIRRVTWFYIDHLGSDAEKRCVIREISVGVVYHPAFPKKLFFIVFRCFLAFDFKHFSNSTCHLVCSFLT